MWYIKQKRMSHTSCEGSLSTHCSSWRLFHCCTLGTGVNLMPKMRCEIARLPYHWVRIHQKTVFKNIVLALTKPTHLYILKKAPAAVIWGNLQRPNIDDFSRKDKRAIEKGEEEAQFGVEDQFWWFLITFRPVLPHVSWWTVICGYIYKAILSTVSILIHRCLLSRSADKAYF